MAVECERAAYEAQTSAEANEALVRKAACYKQCGRFSEAASTLARVAMFALDGEMRREVMYERELAHYLAGECEAALSVMEEREALDIEGVAGQDVLDVLVLNENSRWNEARKRLEAISPEAAAIYDKAPKLKNSRTAAILSFLPPLGHFYAGRIGEGLLSLGLNAAAVAFGVYNVLDGCWFTGWLGGGVALDYTYFGNQERTAFLVEKYNHDAVRTFNDSARAVILDLTREQLRYQGAPCPR